MNRTNRVKILVLLATLALSGVAVAAGQHGRLASSTSAATPVSANEDKAKKKPKANTINFPLVSVGGPLLVGGVMGVRAYFGTAPDRARVDTNAFIGQMFAQASDMKPQEKAEATAVLGLAQVVAKGTTVLASVITGGVWAAITAGGIKTAKLLWSLGSRISISAS